MKYAVEISFLICSSLCLDLAAQEKSAELEPDREARQLHAERVAQAIALGEISVPLKLMAPSKESTGPRWSPYGSRVPLVLREHELFGQLKIGSVASFDVKWTVPKEVGADAVFWLDADQDQQFDSTERTVIKSSLSRGKHWYSGTAVVELPAADGGVRSYPLSFWRVIDPKPDPDDPSPEVMLWTRRGWAEGRFKMGGTEYTAVISESIKDGVFNEADSWGLGESPMAAYRNSMSKLSKHTWLGGIAYKPTEIDEEGRSISLIAHDPGLTQEEEAEKNDPYAADKKLARAAQPVKFENDLAKALDVAKANNQIVVVDFVTTWCGPCRMMDQFVYSAKPVVEAMQSVVAVKLDGDEKKALVKKYKVKGYPTVLILDADGEVIKRQVGYVSAARLMALLREVQ